MKWRQVYQQERHDGVVQITQQLDFDLAISRTNAISGEKILVHQCNNQWKISSDGMEVIGEEAIMNRDAVVEKGADCDVEITLIIFSECRTCGNMKGREAELIECLIIGIEF
tara:strand:+ start:59 stop:394 length:336 start_codon:yes stop_codon:yes gene_type:complete